MIEVLLSKGADINSLSHSGTPLHAAIMEEQDAVVKILLDHHADAGAHVNGVGPLTPLTFAANEGLTDFYKCLLQAGADPDVRGDGDKLPIEIAAHYNRQKDVEILFPVTSRIPYVCDWSVDGILAYAKSLPKVEATKHAPGDATLHSNTSLCWIKLGEGDKALESAEFCRTMRPDWPKACYRQGAAQMLLKNYEKACDAFSDGLKLDPTNVEIENALRAAPTTKFKPNPQSRFLADEMEALQERMLQEFAEIRATQGKLSLVDGICEQLAALNAKLSKQTV
ncbi:Heat shock protein STI [Hordeum vulgare]|nr:Heat shock protein STI [Hordeum vulgare]